MTETSDTQAFAQMSVSTAIVDYLQGEGSTIARDTLEHANAIAQKLSALGLLIAPDREVAISPERLNELKHAEVTLAALDAAGVDNWEHYDDAVAAMYKDDVVQ